MKLKEQITIEDFDGQKVKIRLVEADNSKKAVITHYLHNYKNGVSKHYKKDAERFINEYLLVGDITRNKIKNAA
jgi:DNA (cytosine-5)-methyltransferase 1